jgi:signal transduction histidine kinase
MGAPTDEIEQALHGLLMALLYGLPVVILIVSTGGYVLVRRALQPVEHIRATAEKITFGNLSNRLPTVMTGDAIEHLSVTLNQMINRLENSYEQASRFSADASHELRTPLTIMRGELEAMAHQKDLPKHLQERLGSVLEETERLSHITESLFAISRLDAGEAMVEHRLCDLAALAQSTAEQMSLLAEEKQIALHIDTPQLVTVIGDAARLKQVVVNLLDNAIKYTPNAGRVDLKVTATSSRKAVLEVSDNGSGIPADALPHVFTRFYRADKVRSRDMGGAGLGLSIVQSIVQAHGGTVEIFNNIQGITCRVELPLADHRREG